MKWSSWLMLFALAFFGILLWPNQCWCHFEVGCRPPRCIVFLSAEIMPWQRHSVSGLAVIFGFKLAAELMGKPYLGLKT